MGGMARRWALREPITSVFTQLDSWKQCGIVSFPVTQEGEKGKCILTYVV